MYVGNLMFDYYDGRIHFGNLSFVLPVDMVVFSSENEPFKEILIGLPDADWRIVLTSGKYDNGAKQFNKQGCVQHISFNTVDGLFMYNVDIGMQCCEYHFDFQCDWGDNVFVVIIKAGSETAAIEVVQGYETVTEFFNSIMRN